MADATGFGQFSPRSWRRIDNGEWATSTSGGAVAGPDVVITPQVTDLLLAATACAELVTAMTAPDMLGCRGSCNPPAQPA